MFENQTETVDGSNAEGFTGKDNLAVCVLVDILNESMAAIDTATAAVHQGYGNSIQLIRPLSILHFTINVFKNDSD